MTNQPHCLFQPLIGCIAGEAPNNTRGESGRVCVHVYAALKIDLQQLSVLSHDVPRGIVGFTASCAYRLAYQHSR